jgi:hypothetical protein
MIFAVIAVQILLFVTGFFVLLYLISGNKTEAVIDGCLCVNNLASFGRLMCDTPHCYKVSSLFVAQCNVDILSPLVPAGLTMSTTDCVNMTTSVHVCMYVCV